MGRTALTQEADRFEQTDDRKVCAVIVSFNPDIEHLRAMIDALTPQLARVVVVDNGSAPSALGFLETLAQHAQVDVVPLGENRGIASAHNEGIRYARRAGCHYVLLLDHDSKPAPDMVAQLVGAERHLTREGVKVGAVGPVAIDSRTGARASFVVMRGVRLRRIQCGGDEITEVDFLISSGTLIVLSVFDEIGGMRDELFIDHVDTEWCFRARTHGYRLFAVGAAGLLHSLGDEVQRVWIGRWRSIHVHSPLRDYYMIRNTLLVAKMSRLPLRWRMALMIRAVGSFAYFSLFMSPRARRVAAMATGVAHGLTNRSGKR
jgi:rhamnosyltransferase